MYSYYKKFISNIRMIKLLQDDLKKANKNIDSLNSKLDSLDSRIGSLNGDVLNKISRLLTISSLHKETFYGYKNKHKGKSIAIYGAGPSLNNFIPIPNTINIALNSSILYNKVKFDYFFAIDKIGVDENYKDIIDYDCIKFIGDQNIDKHHQIPETEYLKMNAFKYMTTAGFLPHRFALNIESEPIGNFATVALQAVQFALYTNPSVVYLVGVDCNSKGHFYRDDEEETKEKLLLRGLKNLDSLLKSTHNQWGQLKPFIEMYYPEIKIISINPVGLKGVFIDEYQK